MKRLLGSLAIGVITATVLTVFAASSRHAALAASAARSGGHQTVHSILADGFAGMTVIVAVAVFVVASIVAARRKARRAAATASWSRPRRGRVPADW